MCIYIYIIDYNSNKYLRAITAATRKWCMRQFAASDFSTRQCGSLKERALRRVIGECGLRTVGLLLKPPHKENYTIN